MASMAVLITFLWSNEDSDFFWHFNLSFAMCEIAEFAKLIDFWMSDNLLSTLFLTWKDFSRLNYCLTKFWDSHKLTYHQGFPKLFLLVSFCHLDQLVGYGWTCVCWNTIVTNDLTENTKSSFIYSLVLNIWASFHDLGRNTQVFCYCW